MMAASTRAHIDLSGAVGLALAEGDIRSDNPAEFWLRGMHWAFDDILLSDLAFSPVSVVSSSAALGTEHSYLSIGFLLAGDVTVERDGAHLRFVEGTAAFLTSIFTLTATCSEPSRVLLLSVPRDLLAGYGIEPANAFGALSYSALLHDSLLPFLRTLLPIIQNHSIPVQPTATLLVQLVAALFIADRGQLSSGPLAERALRYAAEEEIGRAFTDAAFGPPKLARRLGVSVAELNTVFSDTGGGETVTATITARRLAQAISTMGLPTVHGSRASILEAARSSGFTGLPGLETAVQTAYGMSAVAVRTGLRRLSGVDYADEGGVQTFVGRIGGRGTRSA